MSARQACAKQRRNGKVGTGKSLAFGFIFLIFIGFSISSAARGEEQVYDIDLPAQPLVESLNSLSEQTGVPVFFPYDLAKNRRAKAVKGRYTLSTALDLMLEDTGLSGGLSNKGVMTISRAESSAPEPGKPDHKGETMQVKTGLLSKLTAFVVSAFAAVQGVPAQGTQSVGAIEEVVVTAQKRAESIQDVPITMDAFSGQRLREQSVKKVDDIVKMAPGLSLNFNNESNSSISIRGIGTDNFHGNVNRAVGIYYDEAFMATPYSGALGVFDLERVEVLRGPQNTLFGRNTTGGAVRYISRKPVPGEPVGGYGQATYGRFDQMDLEGAVSVPLGDDAAARLSLQTVNRDGPFTNLAPGRVGEELGTVERHSGRAQVVWDVTSDTSVHLNLQVGFNRGDNLGTKARGTRDPADPIGSFCPELATSWNFEATNSCVDINGDNPSDADDWNELYNVSANRADIDIYGGAFTIDHNFGWAEISSVTTYYETEVQIVNELSGMRELQFVPQQDTTFKDFSQELRLKSPDDRSLRWLLGAFYFREDMLQGTQVRRNVGGVAGAPVTPFNVLDQKDEDFSVYGQMDADFTDKLTVTAGLRYTHNKKSADSQFGVALTPEALVPNITFIDRDLVLTNTAGDNTPPPPFRLPLLQPRQKIDEFGLRLGFNYRVNDNFMYYANYSRGFKSGGFDTRALAALFGDATTPVKEEILDAWEGGFKSDLFNRTVRFNASAFIYKWKDQQVFATINSIPGFFNLPKSESKGVEASVSWTPQEDWLIQLAGSYLDTEITDIGSVQGIDQGVPLRNTPEFSFNGLVSKDFVIGDNILNVQAAVRYVDEQFDTLSIGDRFLTTRDDQFYLDVRAAYTFGPGDRYQLAAFGENLTSEKHCYDRNVQDNPLVLPAPGATVASTVPCKPNVGRAVWGVSASVNF
ncbi:MAG: TonB-dependent receptor [Gammaproteobacteria bacterium]